MFVHKLWSLHCPSSLLDLDCDLAKKSVLFVLFFVFLLEHLWSHDWTAGY